MEIDYESGIYSMGGGKKLDIFYIGEQVFLVVDEPMKKDKYPFSPQNIKIDDNYVLRFIKGDWIKKVEQNLGDVPMQEIKILKENFPNFFGKEEKNSPLCLIRT